MDEAQPLLYAKVGNTPDSEDSCMNRKLWLPLSATALLALAGCQQASSPATVQNDVAKAQEILQQAYRTDVRALVAEARLQAGAALQPLQLYRQLKVRENLIKERGQKTVATGL